MDLVQLAQSPLLNNLKTNTDLRVSSCPAKGVKGEQTDDNDDKLQ